MNNYEETIKEIMKLKKCCPRYTKGPTGPKGENGLNGATGPTGPAGSVLPIPNANFFNILNEVSPATILPLNVNFNNGQGYIDLNDTDVILKGPGVYYINHVFTADVGPNDYVRITPIFNGVYQAAFLTYSNTGTTTSTTTTSAGILYNVINEGDNTLRFRFDSGNVADNLQFFISIIKVQ